MAWTRSMNDDRLKQLLEMIAGVGVKVVPRGAETFIPGFDRAPRGWSWVHLCGADGQVVPWLRDAVGEVTQLCADDPRALERVRVRPLLYRPEPLLLLCASSGHRQAPREPFALAIWREVQSSEIRA